MEINIVIETKQHKAKNDIILAGDDTIDAI